MKSDYSLMFFDSLKYKQNVNAYGQLTTFKMFTMPPMVLFSLCSTLFYNPNRYYDNQIKTLIINKTSAIYLTKVKI